MTRPGGWVDGIGWVAQAHELPHRTWFTEYVGGPEFMRGLGTFPTGVVVIVTRWADGTTPEPPAPDAEVARLTAALEAAGLNPDRTAPMRLVCGNCYRLPSEHIGNYCPPSTPDPRTEGGA